MIQDCIQDANLLLEGKELLLVKADENKTFFWLYVEAILIHKNHFKHDRRSTSLDIKHEAGHDYNVKDDAESKSTDLNELDNFFRAISDLDIQIIRMNHLDGYSLKEIAIKLGKPAKMIEKRHERAMQILTAAGTRERERERERDDYAKKKEFQSGI